MPRRCEMCNGFHNAVIGMKRVLCKFLPVTRCGDGCNRHIRMGFVQTLQRLPDQRYRTAQIRTVVREQKTSAFINDRKFYRGRAGVNANMHGTFEIRVKFRTGNRCFCMTFPEGFQFLPVAEQRRLTAVSFRRAA